MKKLYFLTMLLFLNSQITGKRCHKKCGLRKRFQVINNNKPQEQPLSKPDIINVKFSGLVKKSHDFELNIKAFPTINNRISIIANDNDIKQKIVSQAENSHPIIHKYVIDLINNFLEYKKKFGSSVEKSLYQNLNHISFIDRLLIKRPLVFMTEHDHYLLRDGKTSDYGKFETIGTDNEKYPLIIKDYISYDEMQISALIGVSVPTYFINDGNRFNKGEMGSPGTYERDGIYVGLVGARFEKPGFMEWQHIIITPEQNTEQNGYGLNLDKKNTDNKLIFVWEKFYNTKFPTFDEAKSDKTGRYISFDNGKKYFDSYVYKERIRLVIEPFLLDANNRATKQNKKAYIHTVGLGLGVWQKITQQAKIMIDTYADVIKNNNLSNISDINFSWFPEHINSIEGIKNGDIFESQNNKIKIYFSKRNPADKLLEEDKNKLLIACYAWDGNAFPGNEYWEGELTASGDPAAACCSTISELQNPYINSNVSAANLAIY